MKIDDILKMWSEDSDLDATDLVNESVKSVKLHCKYYDIYVKEKLRLATMEQDRNELNHIKTEYYNGDLDEQILKEKGWPQFQKRILKNEIERYMNADKDIIESNLKLALQREKVTALKDIIYSINQRSFHIKNINESLRFKNGEF